MTTGFIDELSDYDKDPRFVGQTLFGQGSVSQGPLSVLLVGDAGTGGTLTPDVSITRCMSSAEAGILAQVGSELYLMAISALQIPDVELYLATATLSGATAATATITIAGTWTTAGSWRYRIGGVEIFDGISASDTLSTVAANIAAYINLHPELGVTATSLLGVVTLTLISSGVRGNDWILVQNTSELPAGATSTLAGGASVTNGGVRFTSGAGTENITTLLAVEFPKRFDRVGFAQRDSTNVGKWEVQIDAKAAPNEGRLEHAIGAFNSVLLSTATSIAQTTLNNPRFQIMWMKNGETPPPAMAAVFAAKRGSVEGSTPNIGYDDYKLPGVRGATDADADIPNHATRVAALDAGVTPITTIEGQGAVVRSITTRSLTSGGDADDRTVDTSESWVPDWIRDALRVYWTTDFKVKNPYVRDNFAPEENPPRRTGIATPQLWAQNAQRLMLGWEQDLIVTLVALNPVVAQFNAVAKRIVSRVPVIVTPLQHQIEVSVEQVPYNSAVTA